MVGYESEELRNQPMTILYPCIGTYTITSGEVITVDEDYVRSVAEMLNTFSKKRRSIIFVNISNIKMVALFLQKLISP